MSDFLGRSKTVQGLTTSFWTKKWTTILGPRGLSRFNVTARGRNLVSWLTTVCVSTVLPKKEVLKILAAPAGNLLKKKLLSLPSGSIY